MKKAADLRRCSTSLPSLLKCVFSLITDTFIRLLRVILQLRDCCKAWQFTLERCMLLLLIYRQNIITELRGIENSQRISYQKWNLHIWIHCDQSLLQVPWLNYTGSSGMAPNYPVKISSQYLKELLYPPVDWTIRERNANRSSGC